jgi:glutathione peroxidase
MTLLGILLSMATMGLAGGIIAGKKKKTERENEDASKGIYQFKLKLIDGRTRNLVDFRGKVLLIVNTASYCGHTPQFADLQRIFHKYRDRGFAVLGFPSNSFGNQDPGTEEEIRRFAKRHYHIMFDLFQKMDVRGSKQHPLFQYLSENAPEPGAVKWNFHKYLVDRQGNIVESFMPKVRPTDRLITQKIEELLRQKLQPDE